MTDTGWSVLSSRRHDLSLVPEKYLHIVKVLLKWEDSLTDGYVYYCEYAVRDEAEKYYKGDETLATLVEIAKEILGESED